MKDKNKKLGQEPAFPCEELQTGDGIKSLIPHKGQSKRFYAACAAKNDFDDFSRRLQEELVGEKAPDSEKEPLKFWQWYAKGRAKWLYMQADELLKQENE